MEHLPPPPSFDYIQTSGGIDEYRLKPNDLRVLFMPDHAAPVAVCMITYHVGSRNEGPGTTGATHLLEHMMFKGTAHFHKQHNRSIFQILQRLGAQINATTWLDRTNYYALIPRQHLDQVLEIEADRMRNLLLDENDLESERTVVLNEFDRGDNNPSRKLYHNLWSTAFLAHPYHHPTIGWRSDIEYVTGPQLRQFYNTFYWPNNATLSLIGDLDRTEALERVAHFFRIHSFIKPTHPNRTNQGTCPKRRTTYHPAPGRRTRSRTAGL